jgi:hypothetical protein
MMLSWCRRRKECDVCKRVEVEAVMVKVKLRADVHHQIIEALQRARHCFRSALAVKRASAPR